MSASPAIRHITTAAVAAIRLTELINADPRDGVAVPGGVRRNPPVGCWTSLVHPATANPTSQTAKVAVRGPRYCAAVQVQNVSLLLSLIAVVVAVYGIYERRLAATRAERLRLGVIADDLEKIKLELARESAQPAGDHIEALHSRAELLGQQGLLLLREGQGLSLFRQREISANSSECRAIAFMLDEAGYADNADEVWRLANKKADSEGDVQALYAARGYGLFLLRQGRRDEAHKTFNSGLSRIASTDDTGRYFHAETFTYWIVWEPDADSAKSLLDRVKRLHDECQSPQAKARIRSLFRDSSALDEPSNMPREDTETTPD